jgi:hypothetical protein
MPTATESTSTDINDVVESVVKFTRSDVGSALDRVIKLNERVVETGKRVGTLYLDGYKNTVAAAIGAARKTSGQPLEIVRTLVEAQAKVANELTKTCTGMAREVLAA